MISFFVGLAVPAATLPSIVLAASVAGIEIPAPPPPRNVVETHWNTPVDDSYRFPRPAGVPEFQPR